MTRVTLNVDLGEYPEEPDELYAHATVVNVACGGHAGDDGSMRRAVALAGAAGARIAAHPSYPDRAGFGRVSVTMPAAELQRSVEAQCEALARIARSLGQRVSALKPHGALYHDAARSPELARAVVEGALLGLAGGERGADGIQIVGPPAGELAGAARAAGLSYAREGFADRSYRPDGTLVPRAEPGALITEIGACIAQARCLAVAGSVETICVHADTPGALAVLRAVRSELERAGLLDGERVAGAP